MADGSIRTNRLWGDSDGDSLGAFR